MSAQLEHCPECGGEWPPGPDYSLRGAGWLQGLERRISPTNSDIRIHDAVGGRNRFLHLELKGPKERPIQKGQLIDLLALAEQEKWTVRVLLGTSLDLSVHRVVRTARYEPPSLEYTGIRTHGEAVRQAVNLWLRGALWRDAEVFLAEAPPREHVCGWARVDGVWTCVGDWHAVGLAEQDESACGATLPQYA